MLLRKYVIHATNAYASYLLPQHQANSEHAIVPTRAQVVAVKPPKQDRGDVFWTNGFSANEGFDYFFQRQVSSNAKCDPPPVILGGGRNQAPPNYEYGIADDSSLNNQVGDYLRRFLPTWFPNYWNSTSGVDVVDEWPGIMGFTEGVHLASHSIFIALQSCTSSSH